MIGVGREILNVEADHVLAEQALMGYRERFAVKGLYENHVFEGVAETLAELKRRGYRLFVATAKPTVYAKQILEHFDLAQYFTDIYGSELNGERTNKAELIQYILEQQKLQADQCLMVGDREHDIFGARQNGIDTIAVNYGGGAGGTGTLYLLFFKPCDFTQETGFNRWSGGTILFSNWNHNTQSLTSDSLTFEQCTFRAFEIDAAYMTYNYNDGRCICMDSTATLAVSTELSTAFSNQCYSGVLSTNVIELNSEQQITIYPNPTNSELVLEAEQTSFTKQDNIKVFSILGEELYSSSINSQKTRIDLSKYSQGTYILVTTINGIQKTFKILKE